MGHYLLTKFRLLLLKPVGFRWFQCNLIQLNLKNLMSLLSVTNRIVKPWMVSRIKVLILKSRIFTKLFRLRYFALNGLDKKIERYLDFDNGYFVELGANDGVDQSKTLFFEHFRGWSGVLNEPYEPNYNELVRNRKSTNHFKNVRFVGPTYSNPTVELDYSNLMTTVLGIDSDVLEPVEHANQGSKFFYGIDRRRKFHRLQNR